MVQESFLEIKNFDIDIQNEFVINFGDERLTQFQFGHIIYDKESKNIFHLSLADNKPMIELCFDSCLSKINSKSVLQLDYLLSVYPHYILGNTKRNPFEHQKNAKSLLNDILNPTFGNICFRNQIEIITQLFSDASDRKASEIAFEFFRKIEMLDFIQDSMICDYLLYNKLSSAKKLFNVLNQN